MKVGKELAKRTGCSKKCLKKIVKKGMGAYYSSGSRPNQNAHSWAYARLASTLMKSKAYRVDKHILDEAGVKIKPPPKKRSKKCDKFRKNTIQN